MINAIITGIMNIIISLVGVILSPIDALINNSFPQIQSMFSYINSAFDIATRFFGWLVDASLINREVIGFFILVMGFKFTAPLVVYTIKLAVQWYDKLKV